VVGLVDELRRRFPDLDETLISDVVLGVGSFHACVARRDGRPPARAPGRALSRAGTHSSLGSRPSCC
jgi:hypothetical protein